MQHNALSVCNACNLFFEFILLLTQRITDCWRKCNFLLFACWKTVFTSNYWL